MVKERKRRSANGRTESTSVTLEASPSIENGTGNQDQRIKVNGKHKGVENGETKKETPKKVDEQQNRHSKKDEKKTLGDRAKSNTPFTKKPNNNASLCVLLTQGIMANDNDKVDSVLSNNNLVVITNTLRELQSMHLLPLLKEIERRLKTRGAVEIRPWIRWTQCIFSLHMPYLTSLPNLEKEIGGLLAWMRARIGHQQQLLALHGKLSVIADQIERRKNKTVIPQQPLIMFNNDVDSDPDELESVGSEESGEGSEDDWWDDNELKDDENKESENDEEEEDDTGSEGSADDKMETDPVLSDNQNDSNDDDEDEMEQG